MVVTTGFRDVDLAGGGPRPVGVIDWHHPDSGPKPVTLGHLGNNFHSTVLDRCAVFCIDARRKHGSFDVCVSRFGVPVVADLVFISYGRLDEQMATFELEIL